MSAHTPGRLVSSFTPGPWSVHTLDADDTHAVVRAGKLQIAAVGYAVGYAEPANARLIAAAPELLAALKALLHRHRDGSSEGLWAEWDTARAAIARATGSTA